MAAGRDRQVFSWLRVQVTQIDPRHLMALCHDEHMQEVKVTLKVRVGNGGVPQVGETWMLSRVAGRWVFHAKVGNVAPITIRAPRDSMDLGTEEIFDALIALGLVVEEGSDFTRRED